MTAPVFICLNIYHPRTVQKSDNKGSFLFILVNLPYFSFPPPCFQPHFYHYSMFSCSWPPYSMALNFQSAIWSCWFVPHNLSHDAPAPLPCSLTVITNSGLQLPHTFSIAFSLPTILFPFSFTFPNYPPSIPLCPLTRLPNRALLPCFTSVLILGKATGLGLSLGTVQVS